VQNVAIIDYGLGNIQSVKRTLDRIGARAFVTSCPGQLEKADKLVLPGVGHFRKAMKNLVDLNLVDTLNDVVISKRIPILGICLGMQLFADTSEEGAADGLGWIKADVVRFNVDDTLRLKVPHMGWNGITSAKESPLLSNLMLVQPEFYFVHAYHVVCHDPTDTLSVTEYAYSFTSAIERGNIFGVQFHPEKSHDTGEALLRNFLAL